MMLIIRKSSLFILPLFLCALYSCREVPVPKPRGYFRIDLPEKHYIQLKLLPEMTVKVPFSFEYPSYGNLTFQTEDKSEPGWMNIEFPRYKAKIYLTYKDVDNNFASLMEQTYKMNVKNHISKADAINEQPFINKENKVFGVLYDLKGNTASSVQFYVTDSVSHYLRGSLYFSAEPDADSLAPLIEFFREDIIHLIETLKWNK
jgi:gliding motility-associated lipoprotein GldD